MSLLLRHIYHIKTLPNISRCGTLRSTQARHDPLRVLFCGSDAFSIHSLRALDALRRSEPSIIRQIDVLCRPDKRVGRGLKQIQPGNCHDNMAELFADQTVPIKAVSQELGLQLHQLDTFKDWSSPSTVDLIVTASFGLLVPARILNQARYGGLNVHPSLLPQFRGAAPIQHAIIQRVKTTGVSVQTMHPTKFDHGIVLAQKEVGIQDSTAVTAQYATTSELIERLGPVGGRLLVDTVQKGLFVEPRPITQILPGDEEIRMAPKIAPSDRMIDWQTWTADDLLARNAALSQLWDKTSFARCDAGSTERRIIYKGPWLIQRLSTAFDAVPGTPFLLDDGNLGWTTVDGAVVSPSAATIEGQAKDQGLSTLQRLLKSVHNVQSRL